MHGIDENQFSTSCHPLKDYAYHRAHACIHAAIQDLSSQRYSLPTMPPPSPAGLTLGDSTGPVVAGVVYDKVGLQAAYASQLLPNLLALLALLPLLAWDKRAWGEQRTALDAASCEDQAAQQPPQLEGGKHVSQQADASSSDDVAAAQDCCVQGGHAMPAGECRHSDMAITVPEDAAGACKPICDSQRSMPDQSPCFSRSPQLQGDILAQPPAEPAAATQADSWKAAGSKQLSGPASPHSPAAAVWRVLRCRPVLSECLLVLTCQVARTALDILVPLVLAELSTSTIAVVFAAEALGSVVAPFVADMAVQVHGVSSRKAVLWTMTLMSAVTACVLYLGHHPLCGPLAGLCPRDSQGGVLANLPWGLAALMLLFGACHSSAETLIFGHLAQHLHEERASGGGAGSMSTDVTMNVYVLFWMSGFTVGAYVAGIPAEEAFWQQAVVAGVLGLLLLLSAVAVNVPHLLRQRRRA
jgi:hypothetical protein